MTHGHESWYHDPAVWVATGFALFVAVFLRYVWPKVATALDNRAQAITDQLAQASKLREEAQTVLDNFKVKQAEMEAEAARILEEAQRDAALLRSKAQEELSAMINRRQTQAAEKIAMLEKQAENEIRAKMVELATNAASALIREQVASDKGSTATRRAIAELETSIH